MNRKWILIFLTVTLVLCFLGLSIAGDKVGNSRKGKLLFRKNCRSCHNGGKSQELGPFQKGIEEWNGIFAKDKYQEFACKAEW